MKFPAHGIALRLLALVLLTPLSIGLVGGHAFARSERMASGDQVLKAPFGIDSGVVAGDVRTPPCPPKIAAISGITGVNWYVDKNYSIIDPQKKAQDEASKKPLMDFQNLILSQADAYLRSKGTDIAAARCAFAQIADWSSRNALLGKFNTQGTYDRQWALTAISFAFLAVRDAPTIHQEKVQAAAEWLDRLGYEVRKPYMEEGGLRNNQYYWAALGTILAGIADNDRTLFDWGVQSTRAGLDDVQATGLLPREFRRGDRALYYHIFALTALEISAKAAQVNGVNLYSENNSALDRLEQLVIQGIDDEASVPQLNRSQQYWSGFNNGNTTWMELAYARTHDSRLVPYLREARPIIYPFAGDVTLLFGAPLP